MRNLSWDVTYEIGRDGERLVDALFTTPSVEFEIKNDQRWQETGNLFVETHCFYRATGQMEESGILVSKASHWVWTLKNSFLVVPTDILKNMMWEEKFRRAKNENPPNFSWGTLVPLTDLITHLRKI